MGFLREMAVRRYIRSKDSEIRISEDYIGKLNMITTWTIDNAIENSYERNKSILDKEDIEDISFKIEEPTYILNSRVCKTYANGEGYRIKKEFLEKLNNTILHIIEESIKYARKNNRNTLLENDIE